MTVAELIAELLEMPQDAEVMVLDSDGEGLSEPALDLTEDGTVTL